MDEAREGPDFKEELYPIERRRRMKRTNLAILEGKGQPREERGLWFAGGHQEFERRCVFRKLSFLSK